MDYVYRFSNSVWNYIGITIFFLYFSLVSSIYVCRLAGPQNSLSNDLFGNVNKIRIAGWLGRGPVATKMDVGWMR